MGKKVKGSLKSRLTADERGVVGAASVVGARETVNKREEEGDFAKEHQGREARGSFGEGK